MISPPRAKFSQRAPRIGETHLFVLAGVLAPGLTMATAERPARRRRKTDGRGVPGRERGPDAARGAAVASLHQPTASGPPTVHHLGLGVADAVRPRPRRGVLESSEPAARTGVSRAPEIATRLSLGATRLQVVRRLLLEGVILSLAGGAVGLVLALGGAAFVVSSVAPYVPIGIEFDQFDPGNGLAGPDVQVADLRPERARVQPRPGVEASRQDLAAVLKAGRGGSSAGGRLRIPAPQLLLIGQLAVSRALLTTGALFMFVVMAATDQ